MSSSATGFKSFLERFRYVAEEGRSAAWIARFTRFGYATRGVVFFLIGLLSARAAIGLGRAAGTQEAIEALSMQPFGRILAGLTALGLISYVLWRFIQAALDPVQPSGGAKSILRRLGFTGSGLFYAILSLFALQLALGIPVQGGQARIEWATWALSIPYGNTALGFLGVILFGVGLHAFYRAITKSFMNLYPRRHRRGAKRLIIQWFGQVGLVSLGFTLCIIGFFVVLAARYADPHSAIGIAGALEVLGSGPYGPILLGSVAVGFCIYGLHCFALARYRMMSAPTRTHS